MPEEEEIAYKKYQEDYQTFKASRQQFSKEEDLAILNRIVDLKGFYLVHGSSLWRSLEERSVCHKTQSWQSIKEHFLSVILPNITSYNLPAREIKHFRRGRENMEVTDETGQDTADADVENSRQKIQIRTKKSTRKKRSRSRCSSSSQEEEEAFVGRKKTRKRFTGRIPEDQHSESDSYQDNSNSSQSSRGMSDMREGQDRHLEDMIDNSGVQTDEPFTEQNLTHNIRCGIDHELEDLIVDDIDMELEDVMENTRGVDMELAALIDKTDITESNVREVSEEAVESEMEDVSGLNLPSTEEFVRGLMSPNSSGINNNLSDGRPLTSTPNESPTRSIFEGTNSPRPVPLALASPPPSPTPRPPTPSQSSLEVPSQNETGAESGPASRRETPGQGASDSPPTPTSTPRRTPSQSRSERSSSPQPSQRPLSPEPATLEMSRQNESGVESIPATTRSKRISAKVVKSNKREVVLCVRGLPRDIDPTNVRLVHSLEDGEQTEEDVEDVEDDYEPALKRLKVLSLPAQEKHFRTGGKFREKFRTPYSNQVSSACQGVDSLEVLKFSRRSRILRS